MFTAWEEGQTVNMELDGRPIRVRAGLSVAAAVLGTDSAAARVTAKRHEERGPYCQMGVCYECLMEIDGKPNQQACMMEVKEGMRVRRQQGAPDFAPEGGRA